MVLPERLQGTFDWLLDGARGASTPVDVVARVGADLHAAGVPLDRMAAWVRTLHPFIMGRSFLWAPGKEVVVGEHAWAALEPRSQSRSPLAVIQREVRELRVRLTGEVAFADLEGLKKQGLTDWFGLPLQWVSGETHAITYATKDPAGFSDLHLDWIRQVNRPLVRIGEAFALMRTAANLLTTYVGKNAGERVWRGQIQRGDVASIACVVWFSDLRGFTSLSSTLEPKDIISILNRVFDCQVPAIEKHGGEVLKFMGDGLLAIFPILEGKDPQQACARAVDATREAFLSIDALNQTRGTDEKPLAFGVALHLGDVAYGNIGGLHRLDFTCIGPTVNLASRIESLTGKLGRRLLMSDDFAKAAGLPTTSLGTFEFKGVPEPQAVHELSNP